MTPTSEQEAIIQAGLNSTSNLMIQAYAGCAKTSTLEMLAHALPPGPALALAFNVKIKKELEKRLPKSVEVMTLNGLGHRAFGKSISPRLIVEANKLGTIITATAKALGIPLPGDDWMNVKTLVTNAMQIGVVPEKYPQKGLVPDIMETWDDLCFDGDIPFSENLCNFARMVLLESVKQSFQGLISFDDQIYMSCLYNGAFPRFPLVFVDEAQDLSPLNHIQVKRTAAARLVVVGDIKQAIYGFRGADTQSMQNLRKLREDWIDLPLHQTFRCPKVIVVRCQDHAPGFRAAEANHEGEILDWTLQPWQASSLPSELAILCRNNAPLLAVAFKLLRQGTACTMLGRDIGKGLLTLAKKIMPLDETPAKACGELIDEWAEREAEKALAHSHDRKLAGIKDKAECLLAVLDFGNAKNAGELRKSIQTLFSKENSPVVLGTGHRAKGLEWTNVMHLDPWRIPSRFSMKNPAALEQEMNIKYVIDTRAKHTLILANLEDFT